MSGDYMNGHVPLSDVVAAFVDHSLVPDAGGLSAGQLHDLSEVITAARHARRGLTQTAVGGGSVVTRQTVTLADRSNAEVYREEVRTFHSKEVS